MADDWKDLAKNVEASMQGFHEIIRRMMQPPDTSHFDKLMKDFVPPAQAQAESFQEYIKAHIENLQKNLQPGEELLLYVFTGAELIRVLDVTLPDWHLVVLSGTDLEGNAAQMITNIKSVQFVCKVIKIPPEQEPKKIGFSLPASG